MIHIFKFALQSRDVLLVHAIHHDHGETALPKVIQQDILTLDSLDVIRQITQDVVVDPRRYHTKDRRDQKQYGNHQNQLPFPRDRLT